MFRYAVVAGIALLLLIPLLMVESLVGERSSLYREVVEDISRTWGGLQQLSGPYLLVPYTERGKAERVVPVEGGEDRLVRETRLEASYFAIRSARLLTPLLIRNPAVGDIPGVGVYVRDRYFRAVHIAVQGSADPHRPRAG